MNFPSEMAKTIDRFCSPKGLSHGEYFEKFLDDTLYNFGKPVSKNHIPDKDTFDFLMDLSSIYVKAVISNPYQDLLGDVYQELAGKYKRSGLGQFFTPMPVCDLMTQIVLAESISSFEGEYLEAAEPCIGAGAMMLSFLKYIKNSNPDLLSKVAIVGIDLDIMCCKMASTQIASNLYIHQDSLASYRVFHGNALGSPDDLSLFFGFQTNQYHEYDIKRPKHKTPLNINPAIEFEQMSLFS